MALPDKTFIPLFAVAVVLTFAYGLIIVGEILPSIALVVLFLIYREVRELNITQIDV